MVSELFVAGTFRRWDFPSFCPLACETRWTEQLSGSEAKPLQLGQGQQPSGQGSVQATLKLLFSLSVSRRAN